MELTPIALSAAGKSFIFMLIGFICGRIGLIGEKERQVLSGVILNLINPLNIFCAFQHEFNAKEAAGFFLALGIALIVNFYGIVLGKVFIKKDGKDSDVERLCVFSTNNGFVSMPILQMMFASLGVFYISAFMAVFNVLVWTYGSRFLGQTEKKSIWKVLLIPTVASVWIGILFYVSKIVLPEYLVSTLKSVGSCSAPLGMIVAGAIASQAKIFDILKNSHTYLVCFLKLIMMPLPITVLVLLLNITPEVAVTAIIAAGAPISTTAIMRAQIAGKNPQYASGLLALTTFLCVLTTPAFVVIYEHLN